MVIYIPYEDTITLPSDAIRLRKQLGELVIETVFIDGGHLQFFVRKDASYLVRLMKQINQLNSLN